MAQSVCDNINDPVRCQLQQLYMYSDPLFLENTTLYVVYGLNLALVFLFWICIFFRIRNDYASYYLLSSLIPYTFSLISVVARKIITVSAGLPELTSWFFRIEMVLANCARIVFPLTTLLFMLFTIYVACSRKYIYPSIAFILNEIIVGLVLATLALAEFVPTQIWRDIVQWINYVPLVATIGTVVLLALIILTLIFTCCCCRSDHHDNPVVYNSKRRLLWTFIYVVVVYAINFGIPIYISQTYYFPHIDPSYQITLDNIRPYLVVVPLAMNLMGIYVLIPAFLLLPTFRTALFCISNGNRATVLPTTNPPKA